MIVCKLYETKHRHKTSCWVFLGCLNHPGLYPASSSIGGNRYIAIFENSAKYLVWGLAACFYHLPTPQHLVRDILHLPIYRMPFTFNFVPYSLFTADLNALHIFSPCAVLTQS